jgi:hypothetical protein
MDDRLTDLFQGDSMGRVFYAVSFACLLSPTLRAETPQEIFDRRIVPIFRSPNPSSCVQCHLAGVDLKNYILPSARDTFVSLRDQGLVDLDNVEKSRILHLVQMGNKDKGQKAAVHQRNREREFEAFAAWLKASAADPELRNAPKLEPAKTAKPSRPVEVIRHARKDRLLESFENNVWAMRFRCMNCHSEGNPQNQKLVAKWGERVAWFKADGPEATLDYLLNSKLIDVKNPEKSLLLRKPLNEVKHEGGVKFIVGDQGYKAMRSFVEDYARIVGDRYRSADALPKANARVSFGTDRWIKLAETLPAWGDKLLQVDVFAWDTTTRAWEREPIATTDRKVWGQGKQWQHTLTLLATKDSERAKKWTDGKPALERGRYLVKVYVDSDGKLAGDWQARLGNDDFVGQVEIESAWPEGYGKMTVIESARVKK